MKVLVCGSRDWTRWEVIRRELMKLPPGTIIVHGRARGADMLADEVAKSLGLSVRGYPADWDQFGIRAGPIRNTEMLEKEHPDQDGVFIDFALAFAADFAIARGTGDMMRKCRRKGIRVEAYSV